MLIEFAHVRNMVAKELFRTEEYHMLMLADETVLKSAGPFTELIHQCIENCLKDIKNNKFNSAYNELNFIHNFPIDYSQISEWDEHYFYIAELLGYIDRNEDYFRIKQYISLIAIAQSKIDQYKKKNK